MCFIFHKWGKWEDSHETSIIDNRTGGISAYVFIQARICTSCGYKKYKEKRVYATG